MVELFESDIKTNDRKSSKGNQLKWLNNDIWYKADYTGYEGLTEYVISKLLQFTGLDEKEYVIYTPTEIKYKEQVFRGVSSKNFLHDDWQVITLERLFQSFYGRSLNNAIWSIKDPKERLKFLVENVERMTGLKDFGKYMNKVLTIDAFFLNEDRHTHNIAVLMNGKSEFDYCPIFDNGAGLLADTYLDYPMNGDIYKQIDSVKAKTFSLSFDEQLDISEALYGMNMKFSFNKKDVLNILSLEGATSESIIYPKEIRERVCKIIFEQMRKYAYLF